MLAIKHGKNAIIDAAIKGRTQIPQSGPALQASFSWIAPIIEIHIQLAIMQVIAPVTALIAPEINLLLGLFINGVIF